MSKSTIKKLLQSMTKEDIIEMVLELYSARKEVLSVRSSILKNGENHRHAFPFAEKPWQTSRSSNLLPMHKQS